MLIVTAQEMYDIDRYTIEEIGLGSMLMENAGRAVSEKLIPKIKTDDSIVVLAGGGHNGGDGFVVARTLHNLKYNVTVLQVVSDEQLVQATTHQKKMFQNCDGNTIAVNETTIVNELIQASVIIDAITGLGIKGQLRSPLAEIVNEVNRSNAFICSIDIPSGLPADEGTSEFTAIKADMTVIIAAIKESVLLQSTAVFYGKWELVHIGHPMKVFSNINKRFIMSAEDFTRTIPERERDAHKGSHGKGLLIGGSDLMPGAAVLAGEAALRTGAGLLTIASTDRVIGHVANHCPEAMHMILPNKNGGMIHSETLHIKKFNAIALGVGLGRQAETAELVASIVREAKCPLIIDADGIYHLKSHLNEVKNRSEPTIITPHSGEMARLLNIDVETLLKRPFHYSQKLAQMYDMYVVLKGKATIITSPSGKQAVDLTGNPGLAKGGTGDVLTGIALAMIMQEQSVFHALCNACFVHGTSADLQVAQSHSVYDLMATDVIHGIPPVYRKFLS